MYIYTYIYVCVYVYVYVYMGTPRKSYTLWLFDKAMENLRVQ